MPAPTIDLTPIGVDPKEITLEDLTAAIDVLIAALHDNIELRATGDQVGTLVALRALPQQIADATRNFEIGLDGGFAADKFDREILGIDLITRALRVVGLEITDFIDKDSRYVQLVRLPTDPETGEYPAVLAYDRVDGAVTIGRLSVDTRQRALSEHGAALDQGNLYFNGGDGQSNGGAGGGKGAGTINVAPVVIHHPMPKGAVCFNAGPYPDSMNFATPVSENDLRDLVPYKEIARAGRGHTPGSGALIRLAEDLVRLDKEVATMLWCSNAKGGQAVADLSQGTIPYENGLIALRRAASLANAYGRVLIPMGSHVAQGEQDREDNTPFAVYKAALEQWASDKNADAQEIYPMDREYCFFLDQLCATPNGNASDIPLAQLAAAQDASNIILLGPTYQYAMIDDAHFMPKSDDLRGERASIFQRKHLRGQATDCCRITDHAVSGNSFSLTVNVPNDALRFDTDRLPLASAYGFDIDVVNITTVNVGETVGGVCLLSFGCDGSPQGGVVTYAQQGPGATGRSGAWGNVRDSAENEEISAVHPDEIQANWLVNSQLTLT